MYGAGRGVITASKGQVVRHESGGDEPGFGGVHPEPIARYSLFASAGTGSAIRIGD
jgi:hypothetical protein